MARTTTTTAKTASAKSRTKAPKAAPTGLVIQLTYKATDGATKRATFKTTKAARAFADKWIGAPELGTGYAVSGDGVGRITWKGCTAADLWPELMDSTTSTTPPAVISDAAAAMILPPGVVPVDELNPGERQPGESRTAYRRRAMEALAYLTPWLPAAEAAVMQDSQEFHGLALTMAQRIRTMPTSYSTDGQGDAAVAVLHYFHGGASDWYLTERDAEGNGTAQCFGLAILNGDTECAELGYISVAELTASGAELDLHFEPTPLGEVRKAKGVRALDGDSQPPASTTTETAQTTETPTAAEVGAAVREGVHQGAADVEAGQGPAGDDDDLDEAPAEASKADEKPEALPPVQTIKSLATAQVLAALQCAAVNDVRYYMNTVLLVRDEQGGGRIVSSDGHRMLVQDFAAPVDLEWLGGHGVLLSAPELKEALAILNKHGETFALDWAPGHSSAILRAADGFATLRVPVVDGKFPEWRRIMASVDLSNRGGQGLDSGTVNGDYLKSAAVIAKIIGAKAVQAFTTDATKPSTFLFDAPGGAVLIIMPVRNDAPLGFVTKAVASIVGASGLASSVGALRAHATRTERALKRARAEGTPAKALEELQNKLAGYEQRIAELLAMTANALPAPAKA